MIRASAVVALIGLTVAGCAAETKYVPVELIHTKPERPTECRTREALPLLPVKVLTPPDWENAWLQAKAVQRRNAARDTVCQHFDNLTDGLTP